MQIIELNRNWRFKNSTASKNLKESEGWKTVDLPHDFSIELDRSEDTTGGGSNAHYPGGIGWYEKELDVPEAWLKQALVLNIEGIYMNSAVYVNGHLLARQPYGYTSYQVNLSGWLKAGKNKIKLEANNAGMANTRWYSGSGVYRPVQLLVSDKTHVNPWDITIITPIALEKESKVVVKTRVNRQSREVNGIPAALLTLDTRKAENAEDLGFLYEEVVKKVAESEGDTRDSDVSFADDALVDVVVLRHTILAKDRVVATHEEKMMLLLGDSLNLENTFIIPNARLWTVENPFLYELKTEIIRGNEVIDTNRTSFGIRTVSVGFESGLLLNGQKIKMKGGCVHHDCGLLGTAAYARAEERKVELLKASGYNAVRCAHNPPSVAFLDACDRLGMLVIDEAFDCFRCGKNPGDYSLSFEDWWQRDMLSMIFRDRNHPSIVLWSTGNEIIERNGTSNGAGWSKILADFVRRIDDTRPVTNALCDSWQNWTGDVSVDQKMTLWELETEGFASALDVVGYNYLLYRYEHDVSRYPNRIICGTETFPKDAFDYWEATEKYSHIIGDFVWTSLDYLGESGIGHAHYGDDKDPGTPFPWHQANCGDIDICGTKRPQSYYRDCIWGISEKPYIAVLHPDNFGKKETLSQWGWPDVSANWNWNGFEGKLVKVDVYSREEEVVLFLNGVKVGRKPAGKANKYLTSFDVTYATGKLEAVGFTDNKEMNRHSIQSTGEPAAIRLSADRSQLNGLFGDLSYITAEVVDAEGNVVTDAENMLYFAASGGGSLLAVGNGNPKSTEKYTGNVRSVYNGIATAVVRGGGGKGKGKGDILLTVSGEGLKPASIVISQ